jgi:hypothetical protein
VKGSTFCRWGAEVGRVYPNTHLHDASTSGGVVIERPRVALWVRGVQGSDRCAGSGSALGFVSGEPPEAELRGLLTHLVAPLPVRGFHAQCTPRHLEVVELLAGSGSVLLVL